MNLGLKFGLTSSLFFSSLAHAIAPVEGLYLGITAGGNFASNVDVVYPYYNNILIPYGTIGSLSYDFGGNFGGQLGYKYSNYRMEAEFDYAYLGFNKAEFNGIVIKSKKSTTEVRFGGNTRLMSGFINGYYDFFTANSDGNFVPYVGLGIGIAQLRNTTDLTLNSNVLAKVINSQSSGALQGILGFSYYLDDFTRFSLDYRYLSTNTINRGEFINQRFTMNSINLNFNFALAS